MAGVPGNQKADSKRRYWEVDMARGVAVVMMVIFHTLYDLDFLRIAEINVHPGFWRLFAYATASSFVFLVGLSLSISSARTQKRLGGFSFYRKYLKRGLGIFALAMIITLVTWLVLGEGYILFGILHLIGLSIVIAPFFFSFGRGNFLIALAVILLGWYVAGIEGPLWLAWLGIHPASFYSVDYEPLLPWFGLILMGFASGTLLFPGGKRRWDLPELGDPLGRGLVWLGQHSLFIYLVHQPVIIGLLLVIVGGAVL
jgi:uncharacterized membrane protein